MEDIAFIDALVEHLEDRKLDGQELITISEENRAFLRSALRSPAQSASKPTSRPAPPSFSQAPQAIPPTPGATQPSPVAQPNPPAEKPQFAMPSFGGSPTSDQYRPEPKVEVQGQPTPAMPGNIGQMGWDELERMAQGCMCCDLCRGRNSVVFGVGNREADLMFIGEGPGADEDAQGIPFVGEAGKLLTKIIEAMQMSRDAVYIANIVKCRPPRNRNPEPVEADTCLPILRRQIELVNPKAIVLLGAVPLNYLLNVRGIMRNRGKWLNYNDIAVMPTYHPSFLLRKPEHKRDVWEDMKQVMARFGLQPSPQRNPRR